MKKIISLLSAVFVIGLIFAPTVANATCSVIIYGHKLYSSGSSTSTLSYIYGSPNGNSTYYYYGYTTNPNLASTLQNAVANGNRVYLNGSVSSCPTGSARYIGRLNYGYINP
jgi:hypothetical protein